MALGRRNRVETDDNTEIEMVPIMNMFLVLIPFLLLSASFFHIKAINTSVPVLSAPASGEVDDSKPKKSDIKVTVIVELKEKYINISAMSDELKYKELMRLGSRLKFKKEDGYPMDALAEHMKYVKGIYPKSDTVILVPTDDVEYGTIIQTMDNIRSFESIELFPNVVLSAKVG